jgi:hypothetical protein
MICAGRPGFYSRQLRNGAFLFATASKTALGPTQSPIQWVHGALTLGVKWPVRHADQSPPSTAKVTNAWSYSSTPHMSSWPYAWLSTREFYVVREGCDNYVFHEEKNLRDIPK